MTEMNKKWYDIIFTSNGKDIGLLIMRLVFGGMMLTHGIPKLMDFTNNMLNFPDPIGIGGKLSFVLVSMTESVAALFIILGLLVRPAAIPLMFNMLVAAFVFHAPFTLAGSELALLYFGAFAVLFIMGGGRYSLDHMIYKRLKNRT